jgi:hypothetical protein
MRQDASIRVELFTVSDPLGEETPTAEPGLGGTIDSQIGEEIFLKVVRFRHFEKILYFVVKLVVTSKYWCRRCTVGKFVCWLPAKLRRSDGVVVAVEKEVRAQRKIICS